MYYINPNIKNLHRMYQSESRKGYLKLDMNENPDFLPNRYNREILNTITNEEISMYPETYNFINLLSKAINVDRENICLMNGSDDAIRIIIQVFGKPKSDFITVNPTFEMYSVYAKMYGLNIINIDFDKNFKFDFNKFLNSINNNTSLVLIVNPNSPIGERWDEYKAIKVIEKAKENNAIVIIDEAYFYPKDVTFINFIDKYDNIIVLRTFSKAFSVAGCRIGYTISNKYISNLLKKCSSSYPINILALKAAEYLISNSEILEEIINEYKIGKDYLIEKLINYNYEYSYNSANYIMIKPNKNPVEIFDYLKSKKILVKIYTSELLKDWIRVTIANKNSMNKFWIEFSKIDLN